MGALIALVIVAGLTIPPASPPGAGFPTTQQTGPNGYAAAYRWLIDQQIKVVSLRERYDQLDDDLVAPQPGGNLLVITLPFREDIEHREISDLLAWIGAGNTLLVMAALNESPDWSLLTDTSSFVENLDAITGISFRPVIDDEGNQLQLGGLTGETPVLMSPIGAHPLTAGIAHLAGVTDSITAIWQADLTPDDTLVLRLATEKSSGRDAIWQSTHMAGQIIVSASSALFTNRAIARADNRRLLANLLAHHLAADGVVIFDDMHQGLSSLYDPQAFYSDPRLAMTVLFVLAFWLAYLLGTSNRLSRVHERKPAPRQEDFIRAVGGLMARKLTRVATGLLMFRTWSQTLNSRFGSADHDEPPWTTLQAIPGMDQKLLARLQACHTDLQAGINTNLETLHNNLQTIREATK